MNEPDMTGRQMPQPTGFNILCAVPRADEKFTGTELLKPDTQVKIEEHSTTVLFVLKLGPRAYKDAERFPDGPYCKEGDFILVRAYTGTRFKVHGQEFRLIHDDQVEAVVDNPVGYGRA
jgi:co-chaperonin GroES (HSP10)